MKHTLLILFLFGITFNSWGQPPARSDTAADAPAFRIEWNRLFTGTEIRLHALETDTAGFSYIAGTFEGTLRFGGHLLNGTGGKDILLAKLSPKGHVIWAHNFGGMLDDIPTALTIDERGDVYVAGTFGASAVFQNQLISARDEEEVFVSKIRTTGQLVWAKAARTRGLSEITALVVHSESQQTYALGHFDHLLAFDGDTLKCLAGHDLFIVRFDSLGITTRFDQIITPRGNNEVNSAAVDPEGNLYLTGYCVSGTVFGTNYVLAEHTGFYLTQIDARGEARWLTQAQLSSSSRGLSLKRAKGGQLYLSGSFSEQLNIGSENLPALSRRPYFVSRFTPNGQIEWLKQTYGPVFVSKPEIETDLSGRLFVSAYYSETAQVGNFKFKSKNVQDIFLARISPDGKEITGESYMTDFGDSTLSIRLSQNRWMMLAANGTFDTVKHDNLSDDGYYVVNSCFLSKITTGVAVPVCSAPLTLRLKQHHEKMVELAWQPDPLAQGYEVQYKEATASEWQTRIVGQASLIVDYLLPGRQYECRARSICSRGFSDFSTTLAFETLQTLIICDTPRNYSIKAVNPTHATVQWFAENNDPQYTTYEVLYRQLASTTSPADSTSRSPQNWYSRITAENLQMLTDLQPGTEYEVHMLAHCQNNFHSDTSIVQRFTTLKVQACDVPGKLAVDFITSNTAHVQWQPENNSISYRVKWRQRNTSAWEVTNSSLNTLTIVNLEPDTDYEISVRAKCDSESYSHYSGQVHFRTLIICEPPRAVTVTQLTSEGTRVKWETPQPNPLSFLVQYQNLKTGEWQSQKAYGRQAFINNLNPETEYAMQVYSLCGDTVRSASSGSYTFSTLPNRPCNAPENLTIVSNEYKASISWSTPSNALGYLMMWKLDKPGEPWTQSEIMNPARGDFAITGLLPEATYLLRLQTQCLASNAWIEKSFVTLPVHMNVLSLENAFDIKADSKTGQLTVDYSLPKAKKARIEFYNLLGNPIAGYDLLKPIGQLKVDTDTWSTGVVFCKLIIDEQNYSIKKLAISK